MTSPAPRTSPSTRPSICMSPTEVSEPLTTRSALMIDGVDAPGLIERFCCARLGCGGGGAACADSLLLLENMSSGLDEVARIARHVFVRDLIVNMRSGAAPRRSELPDWRALLNSSADAHEDRGKMPVARVNSIAMVNFDQISVAASFSRVDNGARGGCIHIGAPRTSEIDTRVERMVSGKRINPRSKAAGAAEFIAMNRDR